MIRRKDVAQNGQEVSERVEVETDMIGQPWTPSLQFWNVRKLHLDKTLLFKELLLLGRDFFSHCRSPSRD